MLLRITKILAALLLALVSGLAAWLTAAPPALIRVATSYSAKIVCSNVFLAGRDAQAVLQDDVQAPGHPILKFVKVAVDESEGTARAGLFGLFGGGLARHAAGAGCASVPDGDLAAAAFAGKTSDRAGQAAALWPEGETVAPSQDPAIAAILDDPALTGPGMRAVVVVKNGRIIGERYGAGFSAETRLLGWSMTKTVNAALLGTVAAKGAIAPENTGLLAEWAGDGRKDIALADLMSMSSGLAFNEDYGTVTDVTRMLYLEPDMAAFAASQPSEAAPGKKFNYSSGTAVILSRLWQKALGDKALGWPQAALFGPLGMTSAVLEPDARGTYTGSSYLYATAHDWVRFGQFVLQNGAWNGQAIVSPQWAAMMAEPSAVSDIGYGPQYTKGQMWLNGPSAGSPEGEDPDKGFDLPADTRWALGHDGQSMAIIPSKGLVVLRMGLTPSRLGYKSQKLVQALLKTVE